MRLTYEGLPQSESSVETAMERYAYYICFKCGKAYYGGEAQCQDGAGEEDFRAEELLCGGCSNVNHAEVRASKIQKWERRKMIKIKQNQTLNESTRYATTRIVVVYMILNFYFQVHMSISY